MLPAGVVAELGGGGLVTEGELIRIAFSPGGERLAALILSTESRRLQLNLWSCRTGRLERAVAVPLGQGTLWFSADGKSVCTGNVAVEVESGKLRQLWPAGYSVFAASADGRLLAGTGDSPGMLVVRELDGAVQEDLWSTAFDRRSLNCAAFSQRGDTLAAGTSDGRLLIFDARSGRQRADLTAPRASSLAFLPDGKRIVIAGAETPAIHVLDVGSGKVTQFQAGSWGHGFGAIVFSVSGKLLASAERSGGIRLTDTDTSQSVSELPSGLQAVHAIAFSPDGSLLAAGGRAEGGYRLQVWKVAGGKQESKELFAPSGPRGKIEKIAFASDGRRLATGCGDGKIHLWDVEHSEPLRELEGAFGGELKFSPNGRTLMALAADGRLAVWDGKSGAQVVSRHHRSSQGAYTAARFSPDGSLVACGDGSGGIDLFRREGGEKAGSVQTEQRGNVRTLALSPQGKLLACSIQSRDLSLQLRECASGKLLRRFSGGSQVVVAEDPFGGGPRRIVRGRDPFAPSNSNDAPSAAEFSPGGELIAAFWPDGLHVWEVSSGEDALHFPQEKPPFCFAPNGKYLVHRQGFKLIVVELLTGESCLELFLSGGSPSRSFYPSSLAMSPDGRLLAVGVSPLNAVWLWSLAPPGVDRSQPPSPSQIAAAWDGLLAAKGSVAYQAAWTLASGGNESVALLRERLATTSESRLDPGRIERLIAELNDDEFALREQAAAELQTFGPPALPMLRQQAAQATNSELKHRLARILSVMRRPTRRFSGELLRRLRAIGVLEQIGTPFAAEVLSKLAEGPEGARETIDAQAALGRLEARSSGD